ncbi:MAG: glutamine-hydrolyzing GMP synthase [Tissierellia bacterium]|nr:glutamine-hydrolyzing GMP synthase [Tissierellia bacterium]
MKNDKILVIDFGGSHKELIARKIRDRQVYCEVLPFEKAASTLETQEVIGMILTGPTGRTPSEEAVEETKYFLTTGLPILGIGYGMTALSLALGGGITQLAEVAPHPLETTLDTSSDLFKGLEAQGQGWLDLSQYTKQLPSGFRTIGSSDNCPIAAMENKDKAIYGLQFHPESPYTQGGDVIISNFMDICGAQRKWKIEDYAVQAVEKIRKQVGDKKVLLGLSGGVDSSVCAKLIDQAVGSQLTCIFVDHGLLRKDEGKLVQEAFQGSGMNLVMVDARDRFLDKLEGVTDPEEKRKIIGEEFIRVFEDQGKEIGSVDFLAQGTIYPDIIESGGDGAQVIKSHHNVGGLPSVIDFKSLIEPLRILFKDEVRKLGVQLGLEERFVSRQPFPGPGLAVRIMGEITREKIAILQEADAIFREEIGQAGLHKDLGQYFAVLTNNKTVGVKDGKRTYAYTLALRAVRTEDYMTAAWAPIPYEVLDRTSRRIIEEVDHINRVVYDITSKPPGTIEWE